MKVTNCEMRSRLFQTEFHKKRGTTLHRSETFRAVIDLVSDFVCQTSVKHRSMKCHVKTDLWSKHMTLIERTAQGSWFGGMPSRAREPVLVITDRLSCGRSNDIKLHATVMSQHGRLRFYSYLWYFAILWIFSIVWQVHPRSRLC